MEQNNDRRSERLDRDFALRDQMDQVLDRFRMHCVAWQQNTQSISRPEPFDTDQLIKEGTNLLATLRRIARTPETSELDSQWALDHTQEIESRLIRIGWNPSTVENRGTVSGEPYRYESEMPSNN